MEKKGKVIAVYGPVVDVQFIQKGLPPGIYEVLEVTTYYGNKIVLEIKTVPKLKAEDFRQVLAYLKAHNLKLGILANFRGKKLMFKRILNTEKKNK